MCKVVEELCNDTRNETLKDAILAFADAFSTEEIARRLQVSLDFVKAALSSVPAQ